MDIDQRALPIYSGTFIRPVDLLFYHTVRWGEGSLEPDLAIMMMMINNALWYFLHLTKC